VKTLVTGGAGFIGSHVAERLTMLGHSVRILDNLSTGKRANFEPFADGVEFIHADVRDGPAVEEATRGCDVVFHQAAIVSVPYSVEHPQETHDANLQGTLNVLQAARRAGVRRVVLASSAAVYGDSPALPKVETMAAAPISPYGVEKIASEYYLFAFGRLYGFEGVALRYFNVFGPRQDPSSPYSGVISIFVDRAMANQAPMIFGDGSASRDFVFVENVVDANLLAATRDGVAGRSFNIACGTRTSLNELVSTIGRIVGRDLGVRHAAARAGDIAHSVADISCARDVLGYEPRVGVEEGLRRFIDAVRRDGR
jgi:UDP-glucose 4-epimerase